MTTTITVFVIEDTDTDTTIPVGTVTATTEDAELDSIYAEGQQLIDQEPELESLVRVAMGAAGYDWPRGSGNYNGGIPAEQMTYTDWTDSESVLGMLSMVLEVAQSR